MKNSMDGIKNNNKIPGSERMTRPEEISALSKYLGNIRKVQEEHTKLDKTDLEIPGVTTGYIPEINKLPENALELGISESNKLSDYKETLDIDKNNISLPKLELSDISVALAMFILLMLNKRSVSHE